MIKTTKFALPVAAGLVVSGTVAAMADITVLSWGGAYVESQQKAYGNTWSGGHIHWDEYSGGLTGIREQVEAGNVTWDVADVLPHDARVGCDEGLFEVLPRDAFMPSPNGHSMDDDIMVEVPNGCVVPNVFWSYLTFYDEKSFPGEKPTSIADFFDVEKFPGRRGIHTWPNALIEMALLADGVAVEDIYIFMSSEEGIDRAFAKLDTIKNHVVFWSSGSEPIDLVKSGEVVMAVAFNGRVGAANLNEGESFVSIWDGQILEEQWLVMVRGTKNYDEALDFLIHASAPEQQAGQARWINYGPMRRSALQIIVANEPFFNTGVDIMPHMPNRQEVLDRSVFADPEWWADNGAKITERFTAWMNPLIAPDDLEPHREVRLRRRQIKR